MTASISTPNLIESGDPVDDNRAFRRCLGQFATGVTIMTTCHEGQLAGMSVNSFAALSLDPPLVLWSIRRQSASLTAFSQASHFAVNVLSAQQVDLSAQFSRPGDDKFAQSRWTPGLSGVPLLADTIASLQCRREQLIEGGDHLIVIGRVEHYARYGGEPLLFTQGRYAVTQEHPGAEQTSTSPTPFTPVPLGTEQASLLKLLHFTSHHMSDRFDAHRQAQGLSIAQFRIYSWLRAQPHTLEQLRQHTYLGERDAKDTLGELLQLGHIEIDGTGTYRLTPAGRELADASARRVASFEAEILQGLPSQDIARAKDMLGSLAQRSMLH